MTEAEITRRTLLAGAGAAMLATGETPAAAQLTSTDEVVPLWPGPPPGSRGATIVRRIDDQSKDPAHPDRWVRGIDRPVMVVRRPANPNGSAVLVLPGGGYEFLSYDNEGTSQAAWLNARGVTAFILLYRLPAEGWDRRELVPLQDAQRAIRLIRAGASGYRIDPRRVAVLGFSAGGHLAGSLATRHAEATYTPVDAADRLSARPDLAGLLYPVVTLAAPFTHGGSRDHLLGADAPPALRRSASVDTRVDATTPPVFLTHCSDDGLVPIANSLSLYAALLAAQRPAEMTLFDEGGHGFGVRLPATMPAAVWPRLFATFAARKGVFPAEAASRA